MRHLAAPAWRSWKLHLLVYHVRLADVCDGRRCGEGARFFCSDDASTVETHFRWMEEYGLDGVFLQRFFHAATREPKEQSTTVIRRADAT